MPKRPKMHQKISRRILFGGDARIESALYLTAKYPLSRAGDVSKISIEYLKRGWEILNKIERILLKDEGIRKWVRAHGREQLRQIIANAIIERGIRAYEKEWEELKGKDIERVVRSAKAKGKIVPPPAIANNYLGQQASKLIKKLLQKEKEVIIADLGCGSGGTILPIISRLSPEERKKVRIILIDIMKKGLEEAAEELQRLGLSQKQIHIFKINLADIGKNRKLISTFGGKVTLAVSGAALHHTPDLRSEFAGIKKLLKKGGYFLFWDWMHPAWRAPKLLAAPLGYRVEEHGKILVARRKTIEAPKEHAYLARAPMKGAKKAAHELDAAREILSYWITLLGYPEKEKERFLRFFDKEIKKEEPIDFLKFLKTLVGVKPPAGETPFYFWEGHTTPDVYANALAKNGFKPLRGKRIAGRRITHSPLLYFFQAMA